MQAPAVSVARAQFLTELVFIVPLRLRDGDNSGSDSGESSGEPSWYVKYGQLHVAQEGNQRSYLPTGGVEDDYKRPESVQVQVLTRRDFEHTVPGDDAEMALRCGVSASTQ